MDYPRPHLCMHILDVLCSLDPRSHPISYFIDNLTVGLSERQAAQLPMAMGMVLPVLLGDMDRLQATAWIGSTLHYYEMTDSILEMATKLDDRDLLLAAASLSANPAVSARTKSQLIDIAEEDPMILIRMNHLVQHDSCDYQLEGIDNAFEYLRWQCWPGMREHPLKYPTCPTIVIDAHKHPVAALTLTARLDTAGADVRRMSRNAYVPHWFGAQTLLLGSRDFFDIVKADKPGFAESQFVQCDDYEQITINTLNKAIPGSHKLHNTP